MFKLKLPDNKYQVTNIIILLFGKGNENSKSELRIGQTVIGAIFTDYSGYEEELITNESITFKASRQ